METQVIEDAWHQNVASKYDPLIAAFGMAVPSGESKYDPLPGVLRASAPEGAGWVDPVGDLLRGARTLDLTRCCSMIQDPEV